MKINKLELFAIIVSLSAVVTLVFYLITGFDKVFIPFEPNPFIRIPEIIMGIGSVLVLINMIKKNL